jgi:hypothetical protein
MASDHVKGIMTEEAKKKTSYYISAKMIYLMWSTFGMTVFSKRYAF